MRFILTIIIMVISITIFGGCSGREIPTTPEQNSSAMPDTTERTFIYTGTFTIDTNTMTIENREDRKSDLIYNITGFLGNKCPGGCFRFRIVNIVGTVLEIELTIENPTSIQAYDVRLEYIDLFGKTVLNPDSYTDFLGVPVTNIKPFTAFAPGNPNRAFPVGPGGMDTQTIFLDFPPGSISAVNYAVTASFPGMCGEPYEINGMAQDGELTETGGSAVISCHVLDHQGNISMVYLDAMPITGGIVMMTADPINPTFYSATISNTMGAPIGHYLQKIMASSPNPQNIKTYNYVDIEVSKIQSESPVAVISSPCPDNFIWVGMSMFFDGRMSYDDIAIARYAWDFEWDGNPSNFNVDSTLDHLNHRFMDIGIYTVGLRVEDTDGLFGYASVEITVAIDTAPKWSMGALISGLSKADLIERNYNPSRQIVADCDGIIHTIIKNGDKLYYVSYDGWTASTPELVESGNVIIGQPTMELDDNGVVHLVYGISGEIRYRKLEGGTWSSATTLVRNSDVPGYSVEYPSMAVNYKGEIMVVFNKLDSSYIFYIGYVYNDGSGWNSPADLTPVYLRIDSSSYTIPNNDLRAAPDGRFHLVYKSWPDAGSASQYHLWHVIWDSGSWGMVNRFNNDSGLNIALSSFVASDGDLFAVWQTSRFGTFNAMYQRWDSVSQTWGSPIRVSKNAMSGSYSWIPDIGVDANGLVMYVWEYYYNDTRHVYYKQFNELDSASTILNAAERNLEIASGNMANPNVFFGHDNRIHCIWQDDRTDPGNFDANDVYYSVFF